MSLIARQAGFGIFRNAHESAARIQRLRVPKTVPKACLCKPEGRTSGPSRRSVLLSGLAVICVPQLLVTDQASAGAPVDVQQGLDEYERLESEGKLNSSKAFENIRAKLNFKRGLDGRVYVKSTKGKMFAVRLDMETPGTMLIRDMESGEVYGLQTEGFQQIDLTNDQVVIALFADGNWESAMSPITFEDDDGQDLLSKPAANPHLRKLAYEVCRHANLTETDYWKLWESIASDVNNGDPEVVAAALRSLACLPSSQLADRLVVGQLSELLKPCLAAEAAVVRAAAVLALSRVLLLLEVQQAAASSAGLANAYEVLWDEVMDSLLDERPFVVGQAAAAASQLLAYGIAGGVGGFSGVYDAGGATAAGAYGDSSSLTSFMLSRIADRAALRLSAALGPVLEMCSMVPGPGQVVVCELLLALTRRLLTHPLRAAAVGAVPWPPPAGVLVPNLASLVTSVAAYLANQMQSGDAAARAEACGTVLELAADLTAAGPAAGGAAAGLPQGLILGAVDALMQLREREFVEAGLGDICETLADALPALLPAARADVLRKLWPLASRIDDVSRRARVFSIAWKAAIASEMDYRHGNVPQPSGTAGLLGAPAGPPPPPSSAGLDPLGLLADLTVQPAAVGASEGGKAGKAASVVTAVPPSFRVSAQLEEQYLGAILAGKVPAAEASGAFTVAQASAAVASGPSSSSLLGSVASMTRAAPPPPPPLSMARPDSMRSSATSTTIDSARGAKPEKEKEKKSGFAGRFFRSKVKATKGESDGDHGGVAAAAVAAQEQEAAAKKEEAAATAAAAAAAAASSSQRTATPSPLKPPPSPAGSAGGAMVWAYTASAGGAAAGVLARPSPAHATLRHELLQCLLQQLVHHPAAAVAAELCAEHAAAVRHDRNPPTYCAAGAAAASTAASSLARRVADTVQWVAMVGRVLAGSMACTGWEPYVVPAITTTPSTPPSGCVPVDFNNLTADLWLGVLQAALQAVRSSQALLGRMVAEAVEAAAAAARAGTQTSAFAGLGYGMPYGMATGGPAAAVQQQQPEVTDEAHYRGLLSYLQEQFELLQGLLLKLLSSWAALSASARPRVAWVAAHCLALPGHWDHRWELLLECLDALLVYGTDVLAASRRHDLLGSALAGGLFKAGRQAWTDPTKPFLFDIASASALCEAPEYEALGLLVALTALQQLAARLVNAVAEAVPHGHAGAAHGQAVAVAKRLEVLLRRFIGTELAAAPHVRDWCKRILRCLTTIMTYTPPVNLPPLMAALGVIAKQEHEAGGSAAPAAREDDDDSSDASSGYHPVDGQPELPPALAAAAAAAVAAATASTQAQGLGHDNMAVPMSNGTVGNDEGATAEGAAAAEEEEAGKRRAAPGNSYLVRSAAADVPMWGYPFAPLSAIALHNSKRARRHRALSQHLAEAAVAADAQRPILAAALRPLQQPEDNHSAATTSIALGPVLSCRSQYRLDSEAFWSSLPHTHSPWQELTGPADPLLLRGCYAQPSKARGDAATIVIFLSAANRLPVDISDVEVALKTSGPLLSSTRRAAVWELPKLAAHDRAAASFTFKVLGYGSMQLHARLQLCQGPARTDCTPLQLACLPLEVPAVVLLRPPRPLPEAAEFFRAWGTLPVRTELSGVCTWPGLEGGALLLSALLRQPLGCVWLQHVPAVYSFQAAFAADTAPGDSLALVVTTQLMPPAAPCISSETFCTFSIRSSSPDLILSLQSGAAAWLAQLTSGTASLGVASRTVQPAASGKPPLHPRVAALLQSYSASAAQLESTFLMPMASFGLSVTEPSAWGPITATNTVMLKNTALQEWQRLQRQVA
ncbi:hypothetical protein VOLCADRAFT_103652 [Volvox carteri f. nagariensis]|uniref:Uncharacterized protein n=1 Tax=Volvox carteri f. nagariensis TaxID=3068 RepID=D8TNM1_VOLCA|nr:uncharacterized protein VOLCADRAFT_103652 [Volvox carteri f. nagariensis]EFJ51013.1 hypothetical protein VOLCADRAFT_103652 [Volvox carteri f. nagariensis]|eukprot:XP_002948025.1 hypothetical protein VOLCADRAFT_103652 [Volvox carteri f. nagariensis]